LGQIEGETLQITKTRLLPADSGDEGMPPGSVLRRDGGELHVQCGDGPIAVVVWRRPEDR
jgi:methionyl-tRNA formyltransferase